MKAVLIGARLSAWWAAWQFVVYVAIALLLSIALNVWQWKRAITAPLRAEVAGLEAARETAAGLIADGHKRERGLIDAADTVESQLRGAGKAYAGAMKIRPLDANCAPGQARVDAVNRALGAPTESQ